jgi:hypothetical protein
MPKLTKSEIEEFLEGTHLLHLATQTQRFGGSPYIVPMWYTYIPEKQIFEVVGRPDNAWIEFIRYYPFVGYSVARETSPYKRIHGEGCACIIQENVIGEWEHLAIRYLGYEQGKEYYEKTLNRPRIIVHIEVISMVSWSGGEWHKRYLP